MTQHINYSQLAREHVKVIIKRHYLFELFQVKATSVLLPVQSQQIAHLSIARKSYLIKYLFFVLRTQQI